MKLEPDIPGDGGKTWKIPGWRTAGPRCPPGRRAVRRPARFVRPAPLRTRSHFRSPCHQGTPPFVRTARRPGGQQIRREPCAKLEPDIPGDRGEHGRSGRGTRRAALPAGDGGRSEDQHDSHAPRPFAPVPNPAHPVTKARLLSSGPPDVPAGSRYEGSRARSSNPTSPGTGGKTWKIPGWRTAGPRCPPGTAGGPKTSTIRTPRGPSHPFPRASLAENRITPCAGDPDSPTL